MTTPRRIALSISIGLLLLLAWQNGWLAFVSMVAPGGPIDHVVVVNESGDRTAEYAAVVLGKTANELREKKKWRMWDKDNIPKSIQEQIKKLIEGQSLPVVILFRGGEVWAGPVLLPKTDVGLRELLEKNGGF